MMNRNGGPGPDFRMFAQQQQPMGNYGRPVSALPLGGAGRGAMMQPWRPGGMGNQPGQPPMGASQFPPQMNRPSVQPPMAGGKGGGGGFERGPMPDPWSMDVTAWNRYNYGNPSQMAGGQNPAWANPSLPPDQWQGQGAGGPMRMQGPPPQMNPVWGSPPPMGRMQPPMRQNFGRGMEREQRPYPNPAWGGGGSPVQQQPPGQMPFPGPQGRGIFF